MEFKEFCKERKRMCNCYRVCEECPMHVNDGTAKCIREREGKE